MKRISSESSVKEVMRNLALGSEENLRESVRRKNNLEKFAQLRSRNPRATLNLKHEKTAYVKADKSIEEFVDIVVTSKKFKQIDSSFPEQYHDYILQKAFTVHEVAHILYSSYPAMKKYAEKVEKENSPTERKIFENIFNALEDGAIEKFASEEFLVGEELHHLRRTIHEDNYVGKEVSKGDEKEYHYPMLHAIFTAIINIGIYDNGELRKLLDENNQKHVMAFRESGLNSKLLEEIIPKIEKSVEQIQKTTDAGKRVELSYELWKEIQKCLDRSTTPGKNEMKKEWSDEDSYQSGGIPRNINEGHGEASHEPSGESEETLSERREQADFDGDNGFAEDVQEELINEMKQESGDWSDELEEIINSLSAGDGIDEIYIPDDGDVSEKRKREAINHGKRYAKKFRNKLKRQKRNREVRNKTFGKLDTSGNNMMKGHRGSNKIFSKIREGDEKDYNCIIVVDRSASMNSKINDVEKSVGAISYGLEQVGVDVSILETYANKTAIGKPFGTKTEDFSGKLFAGRYGGGTPLRYSIRFGKERMKRGKNKVPFMIVVTDGVPKKKEKVKQEIKTANFPVLGIYLSNGDMSDQISLYDKAVKVESGTGIEQKTSQLIDNIVF